MTYRHRLVASLAYLAGAPSIARPRDLLDRPLLAFAFSGLENSCTLSESEGHGREVLRFRPHIAMGDYAGLTSLMLQDRGVGDLPPVVRPDLLRDGRLVEVLTGWKLPPFDLCLVRARARGPSSAVQAFEAFAARAVPELFRDLAA